ncbi:nuclear transport factor 2 family protein [Altererythrobacter salegens]|uniref:Nuclear transport factor 2 family protein n=1 Tax=Croceibacterium salegens TaxID=1737568 RepID=A0A6I4SVS4_9SPHN|nr:nuclear transport factor 2 family protein [Croceibacterium salegens]MXO59638.1 nuclear transport factor 2 family protein [Croceibacterium salegens]
MGIKETAFEFFDACETGKGWDVCKQWCHEGAGFAAQTGALADVTTLEGYAEWMKGLLGPMPDARYELTCFAADEDRGTVCGAAVFHATHSGEGGPVPPTGKSLVADYCYVMHFEGGKIARMTKIWNDGYSLAQLGWA